MAKQMGTYNSVVFLSSRDSQGDLHNQSHRISEHVAAEGYSKSGTFSQWWCHVQAAIPGAEKYCKKVDNAD